MPSYGAGSGDYFLKICPKLSVGLANKVLLHGLGS